MRIVIELSVPGTADLLTETRRTIRGYLTALEIEAEVVGDVVLAVDEACANVIRHAVQSPDDEFTIRADLSPEIISICIDDNGPGFDPEAVPAPTPDAVSGHGLQMIGQLMTSVEITPTATNGTRLMMQRQLV